ncbi:MAG: hypothetical protein H0T60_11625, partial [Acidobacteria bacterium]|nr:hypothetical protein [Acidobacteriota bacterium]
MIFERHQLSPFCRWSIVVAGAVALLLSRFQLLDAGGDLRFLLLTLITLSLGSRLVVKVPHTNALVSVADSLTILALFLFDDERAVLLAALSAFCTSLRLTRKASTLMLASALASLSMYFSASVLRSFSGSVSELPRSGQASAFVISLAVVALVHAAVY